MNCSIESLVVVNVKLCDLLQSLTKYIPITDSLGAKSRATSDQDDMIAVEKTKTK